MRIKTLCLKQQINNSTVDVLLVWIDNVCHILSGNRLVPGADKISSVINNNTELQSNPYDFNQGNLYTENLVLGYDTARNVILRMSIVLPHNQPISATYVVRTAQELNGLGICGSPSRVMITGRPLAPVNKILRMGWGNNHKQCGIFLVSDFYIDVFTENGNMLLASSYPEVPMLYPGLYATYYLGHTFQMIGMAQGSRIVAIEMDLNREESLHVRYVDSTESMRGFEIGNTLVLSCSQARHYYRNNVLFDFPGLDLLMSGSSEYASIIGTHVLPDGTTYVIFDDLTVQKASIINGIISFAGRGSNKKVRSRFVPFYSDLVKCRGILSPVKKYFSGQIKIFGGEENKIEMIMDSKDILISIGKDTYGVPREVWNKLFLKTDSPLKYLNDYPAIKILRTSKLVRSNS